jgi:hypothetical protein
LISGQFATALTIVGGPVLTAVMYVTCSAIKGRWHFDIHAQAGMLTNVFSVVALSCLLVNTVHLAISRVDSDIPAKLDIAGSETILVFAFLYCIGMLVATTLKTLLNKGFESPRDGVSA